jgi:hypothetical protein
LIAFAEPAAIVPPTSVVTIKPSDGSPPWASTIAGTVVINRRTMMRGFVSLKYAAVVSRRFERLPLERASPSSASRA